MVASVVAHLPEGEFLGLVRDLDAATPWSLSRDGTCSLTIEARGHCID
jgi:hypothetical protein